MLFRSSVLPEVQIEKGRPAQAAAAAYLAKTYLYKAYRQDGADNALTGINEEDLKLVVKYTDPLIMAKGGYGLETDYSMNFLPQYENGAESGSRVLNRGVDGIFLCIFPVFQPYRGKELFLYVRQPYSHRAVAAVALYVHVHPVFRGRD